jgi:DNA-directed RNA polymerase specialized sigma24 family protein
VLSVAGATGDAYPVPLPEILATARRVERWLRTKYPKHPDEIDLAITDAILALQERPQCPEWGKKFISVAKLRMVDHIRSKMGSRRKKQTTSCSVFDDEIDLAECEALELRENSVELQERISKLPEDLSAVVYNYLDCECSGDRAAAKLDYDRTTFYRRLNAAIAILKGQMIC